MAVRGGVWWCVVVRDGGEDHKGNDLGPHLVVVVLGGVGWVMGGGSVWHVVVVVGWCSGRWCGGDGGVVTVVW